MEVKRLQQGVKVPVRFHGVSFPAVDQRPKPKAALQRRFGRLGEALADSLKIFSLDVVAIIASYTGFDPTIAGGTAELLALFGAYGEAVGQFKVGAYGVACSPDGRLFVSSYAKVQAFNGEGKVLHEVGPGRFQGIVFGMAFDRAGSVFIADHCGHAIVVCSWDGAFVRQFGTHGKKQGELDSPTGVALASGGRLYVADSCNHRVQMFERDGSFVKVLVGDSVVKYPQSIAVNSLGEICVVDSGHHRVLVLSPEGDMIRQFGENGSAIRRFSYPVGLALDCNDNIIVVDQMNHRVQVFKRNGYFASSFGQRGDAEGQFYCPHGVCVDTDGRIVVCDANLNVQVFGIVASCAGVVSVNADRDMGMERAL